MASMGFVVAIFLRIFWIWIPVCMATTGLQSNVSRTFDSDTISNCLRFCKDYRYIGLKERDCVCIKEVKNLTPSKACNTTCNNDQTHLCGGSQSFSLYEKVDTNITQKIAPGYKECVYAHNNDATIELFTASCVGKTAEGGLCESDNTSECKNHNWTSIGSRLCRMDLVGPFRWKQVKAFCAGIGGQLVSPSELPLNLENNRTYWLGIHRVTTVHEDKEEPLIMNYTYCSVARKEGDIVMIEAEYCQAKHTFLCQDKDIREGEASISTHSTETYGKGSDSEHAGVTSLPTDYTMNSQSDRPLSSRDIYGSTRLSVLQAAVGSLACLLAISVLLNVCFVRKKKRMQREDTKSEHYATLESREEEGGQNQTVSDAINNASL